MGAKIGAVSTTQHDHRATACRNVLTPHRLLLERKFVQTKLDLELT